jgi:hypothetical protein
MPEFPQALAEVSAGDAGHRRAAVHGLSWYETSWILSRLAPGLLEQDRQGDRVVRR